MLSLFGKFERKLLKSITSPVSCPSKRGKFVKNREIPYIGSKFAKNREISQIRSNLWRTEKQHAQIRIKFAKSRKILQIGKTNLWRTDKHHKLKINLWKTGNNYKSEKIWEEPRNITNQIGKEFFVQCYKKWLQYYKK